MRTARAARFVGGALVLVWLGVARPSATQTLAGATAGVIDAAVQEVLTRTGAPSASVAIVQGGTIVYEKAYGSARLGPPAVPATAAMRYSIGSISKQFTSAALLLLAEEGKLSLDDRVAKWFPDLTRANDVTVRQLLSMTSGYQDFWPQDYVMPDMLKDTTPAAIMKGWAQKPLDFEPGTRWQYSNTNYVIAGQIVERVARQPLLSFLRARVFGPLKMTSVVDTDQAPLGAGEPMRYMRYALGPPREAPKEGKGWMSAAGELAMTASDLARWDVATMNRALLKPASYRELERESLLANGAPTGYGLGVNIATPGGRRQISHGGEVSGFTARNEVYPDEKVAIVVLVNIDASGAAGQIAGRVATTLFAGAGDSPGAVDQARTIFAALQKGELDRSLFTANMNAYFTPQALQDFAASLGPLGAPTAFTQPGQSLRGGMVLRRFAITAGGRNLSVTAFYMPDGKIEQFLIAPAD
ncbi:MAG TPA: serine hydrolase domain-containing protein [Vicinamibacterales bacterium]|jgi:CubicO group peptidase (beta-lactamase class C family)|nr:serine hydrolase domain-containing protein [Vicinamibacterales bacterium]